jgi:hypothetical protein
MTILSSEVTEIYLRVHIFSRSHDLRLTMAGGLGRAALRRGAGAAGCRGAPARGVGRTAGTAHYCGAAPTIRHTMKRLGPGRRAGAVRVERGRRVVAAVAEWSGGRAEGSGVEWELRVALALAAGGGAADPGLGARGCGRDPPHPGGVPGASRGAAARRAGVGDPRAVRRPSFRCWVILGRRA